MLCIWINLNSLYIILRLRPAGYIILVTCAFRRRRRIVTIQVSDVHFFSLQWIVAHSRTLMRKLPRMLSTIYLYIYSLHIYIYGRKEMCTWPRFYFRYIEGKLELYTYVAVIEILLYHTIHTLTIHILYIYACSRVFFFASLAFIRVEKYQRVRTNAAAQTTREFSRVSSHIECLLVKYLRPYMCHIN